MGKHVDIVKEVRGNTEIYEVIKQRLLEFNSFKGKGNDDWFFELCFCLLTANASAKGGMKAQEFVGLRGFLELSEEQLSQKLKEARYRFPNIRAKYIVNAREHSKIKDIVGSMNSLEAREWLVENIKGLGMKESSHFLRNVGRTDLAILDKHILRNLEEELKPLSKDRYKEVEQRLIEIGKLTNTDMAELDLILWYKQTGEVLK